MALKDKTIEPGGFVYYGCYSLRRVQFEGEDPGVRIEIGMSGKDGPRRTAIAQINMSETATATPRLRQSFPALAAASLSSVRTVRAVVDRAKKRKSVLLFAALDVRIEGGGDRPFLGAVTAPLLSFDNQSGRR